MLGNIVRNAIGRLRPVATLEQVRELIARGELDAAQQAAQRLPAAMPGRELARLCLQAEIAYRGKRDDEALARFKEVLALDPGNADAHYGLSLMLYEKGDADSALRHAQFAANAQTQDPRYFAQLGLCHVQLGNYPIAEKLLRTALRALPHDKSCWNNMGIVQAVKGDYAYARRCFGKALEIDPGFAGAQRNLEQLEADLAGRPAAQAPQGLEPAPPEVDAPDEQQAQPWAAGWKEVLAFYRAGEAEPAMRRAEALADDWPDDAQLASRIGKLYGAQGDAQGGIDSMLAFLQRHPESAEVLVALAQAYSAVSMYVMAETCLRRAREAGDESAETLGLLAEVLHSREQYREAVDAAQQAIEAAGRRTPKLLAQLAAAQVMACYYEEGEATYQELFALKGRENNPALGGYSLCVTYLGRFEEAREILDHMLEHNPNEPGLRTQRFQLRLLLGEFAGGWDDYLFRGLSYTKFFRVLPFARWQGEPLQGKRIIVLAEQGLGDQVMFASCLPDLLALGPSQVYVEAIHRVAPTLARSFPACQVIPTQQNRDLDWVKDIGEADFYVPLGDLPARFRRQAAAFPGTPYLVADPARVAYWADRIRQCGPGPYVGVSWRGGTQLTRQVLRSFSPDMLLPVAAAQPATWINLQYGEVAADLEVAQAAGLTIHHWPEAITDLDEFAALITALDAVVTVCNTTVHYAGALGKPVWVLAPHIPEWRYGLYFERMPWYGGVTVLRQHAPGDWDRPVAEAARRLAAWVAAQTPGGRGPDSR